MSDSHRPFTVAIGLLAALSVLDVLGPLVTDGKHPPMAVAVAACALGLLSVPLVFVARRRGAAPPALVALRCLSALSAVPALFVPGVPGPVRAVAAAIVVLNATGVAVAVVASGAQRAPAPAR